MTEIVIAVDELEAQQMSRLASMRGYQSLTDYLRALVAADALVEALREDWQDTEESAETIEASFREAWHDAMTRNVRPIESLWDELDDDK